MKNTPKYLQIAQAMKDMVQKGEWPINQLIPTESQQAEAGAGFEHVYAMTTYHVGIHEQLETFIRIKDRYMLRENPPPAWTGIGVTALSFPGQIVEIQVNAYVPE